MNAFVLILNLHDSLNDSMYLHSSKDGGTDDLACAWMTSSEDEAKDQCAKTNKEFSDDDWTVQKILITVIS
jgi:hypothetical protein